MTGPDQQELRPSFPDGPPLSREERVRQILDETEAILTNGHFLYTSGLHGNTYFNKDAIYPHTREVREICKMWADDFSDAGVETVAAPAMGGITLSHVTATVLSDITGKDVAGVYAEKVEGKGFQFSRGMDKFIKGKRVLVVEDILTTGGSVKSVVDLVRETGGLIVGVGVIINRGGVTPEDIGTETLDALLNIHLKAVLPRDCIKCARGVPINTKIGAGKNLVNQLNITS
jgi:orotate phosphoribosyltransferase